MTRVVCQQFAPQIADLPANRERSVRAIAEAIDAGADVVVLPELVTSGYVFESTDEALGRYGPECSTGVARAECGSGLL